MRLALESNLKVIGEAGDGLAAIELVHQLHPDVVLMDVEMPRLDGIVATRALRAIAPDTAVIIVSLYSDANTEGRALAAGAAAFVGKHAGEEALLAAIQRATFKPNGN